MTIKNGKVLGLGFWKKSSEVVDLARTGKGIIVMPTGTGKTTQCPQLLHEAGFTMDGMVYVSVPKRILAVELSRRVAEEMGVHLGGLVGYQISGESQMSKATRILFMTEGLLRAKIRNNPSLEGISMILFDEFHQRSLMSDFNIALVERARQEGSQCGFLLMSATVDPTYLAQHFDCGVVDGSDLVTTYPITERYVGEVEDRHLPEAIGEQVFGLVVSENLAGNGLIFADGKAMVEQIVGAVSELKLTGVTVLPLHGDLDGEARHAPFATRSGVTITVATDIVETGATLPGTAWVVDSGLAKESGYDPVSDISSLKSREIAQDRLRQRIGRCGRVRAGVYVGMFSKENALARPKQTLPEIFRRPLREVILTIKALGLSRVGNPIRLIDSPPKANWKQAKRQLQQLGFVAETEAAEITPLGYKAVELGCDPREAAMLLKAAELGCLKEMAVAIAASQAKRLLVTPKGREVEARLKHLNFKNFANRCDGWLSVVVVRMAGSRPEDQSLGTWCRENFVSYRSLMDVTEGAKQLYRTAVRLLDDYQEPERPGTEKNLAEAIASALPDRIFQSTGRGWYKSEDGTEARLARESVIPAPTGYADPSLYAWEVIEVPTQKGGSLRLITNAAITK